MAIKDITVPCSPCSATGIESISTLGPGDTVIEDLITCRTCLGAKVLVYMSLNDEFIDLLNDMNDKINDIFEKVNE